MPPLTKVEAIGVAYAEKLRNAGVSTADELLRLGASARGRKEIASKSGISETLILQWVSHVDLFRLHGVGEEYAALLEAAGVGTMAELATRDPDQVAERLAVVNAEQHIVRQLPAVATVRAWVAQAKTLPRVVTH